MVCDALEGFRCCESLAAGVCTGALSRTLVILLRDFFHDLSRTLCFGPKKYAKRSKTHENR